MKMMIRSLMTTDVSDASLSKNEGEPNNSMGSALTVNSDDTVIGTCHQHLMSVGSK